MEMFHAQFILVLQFLKFFLGGILVMPLVLGGSLNSLVSVLTDEQDLSVGVIKIFRLHLRPREAAELFEEPRKG